MDPTAVTTELVSQRTSVRAELFGKRGRSDRLPCAGASAAAAGRAAQPATRGLATRRLAVDPVDP